jgi:hypothetical protein
MHAFYRHNQKSFKDIYFDDVVDAFVVSLFST